MIWMKIKFFTNSQIELDYLTKYAKNLLSLLNDCQQLNYKMFD